MKRLTLYSAQGPAVAFYDAFHGPSKVPAIRGDVAFYIRQARAARGPVLEVACGTGRVTIPVAKAGIRVTGLDLSPHMLAIARSKADGLPVDFVQGDMTDFRLGRKFRLIFIPFRSFQAMLTPDEQRRCLRSVRRHLAPGGRLILNLFDPKLEYCVPGLSEVIGRYRDARDPATGRVAKVRVRWRRNDAVNQLLHEKWDYRVLERGRVVERASRDLVIRWTYRWEMRHLLELEGFEPVACYGDFRGGPPRYGREQVWIAKAAR